MILWLACALLAQMPTGAETTSAALRALVLDQSFTQLNGEPKWTPTGGVRMYVYDLPPAVFPETQAVGEPKRASAWGSLDASMLFAEARTDVRLAPVPRMARADITEVARGFVDRAWPGFFAVGDAREIQGRGLLPGEDSCSVGWVQASDGLTTGEITVRVRPWDGRVVGVNRADFSRAAQAVRGAAVSAQQAAQTVVAAAGPAGRLRVLCRSVEPSLGRQQTEQLYVVRLEAVDETAHAWQCAEATVDVQTGRIVHSYPVWLNPVDTVARHRARVGVAASARPTHTAAGLVFVSDLTIADQPWSSRLSGQLYLRQPDGTISALTCDAGAQVAHCAASAGGRAVAFTRGIWTSVLNLDTGDTALASRRDMPCHQATASADGQWAIGITGTTGTPDLLPAPLDYTKDPIRLRGRVAADSAEGSPCVSSDGRWLYFGQRDKTGTYLARVAPAEVCRARLMPMEDLGVARLAKLPGWIERITECGGALVVTTVTPGRQRDQDQTHYWRVTDDGKQVSELVIGSPRDEEIGAEVTEVADVTAGPTAADVTLSGRVKTPKGEAGRIYQRAAAGGPVKPLTPAYDQTVPLHRFERTGQTAYDVGRRLVLLERANSPHRP